MIDFTEIVNKYKDDVFRIAFSFLKSSYSADDVVQETFIKFYKCKKEFESQQHIKNWLIKVAVNQCKKELLSPFGKRTVPIEDYISSLVFETPEESELTLAVMKLKKNYRVVIHLYYYEGYSIKEMAEILGTKESTIQTRLMRGREQIKTYLKEDEDFEE